MKPLIEARGRVGAQDAVVFVLERPFCVRKELVVETHAGEQTVNVFLAIYLSRFGQYQKIQFADSLLVLGRVAAAHGRH